MSSLLRFLYNLYLNALFYHHCHIQIDQRPLLSSHPFTASVPIYPKIQLGGPGSAVSSPVGPVAEQIFLHSDHFTWISRRVTIEEPLY